MCEANEIDCARVCRCGLPSRSTTQWDHKREGKMAKCIQTDCHQNKRRCIENKKGTETEMERWETTGDDGEGEEEKVKKKEGTIHGQAKSSSIYFQ